MGEDRTPTPGMAMWMDDRTRVALRLACAALVTLSMAGCGDDDGDDAEKDAGPQQGMDAGADSGRTEPPPTPAREPLGDGIAGKACDGDEDCGSGTCATQVVGSTGLLPEAAAGGYCTAPCSDDSGCGDGGACVGAVPQLGVEGQCFATCEETADCRKSYQCSGGLIPGLPVPNTCRPEPHTDQLEDGVAGAACTDAEDCPGGQCRTTRGGFAGVGGTPLPGGYCSGACLRKRECGEGGVCVSSQIAGFAGECYQACRKDSDCERDGYRCREFADGARGCDAAPDPLPNGVVGDACADDADCGGAAGSCATNLPASGSFGQRVMAPGGYCSLSCSQQSDCGRGGLCIGGVGGFGAGTCFAACAIDDDCRDGYLCEPRGAGMTTPDGDVTEPSSVCVPAPPPADEDAGI